MWNAKNIRLSLPTGETDCIRFGRGDRIVTGEASEELAGRIPGSRLILRDGLGHGLYEEDPDFLPCVADFCR